MFEGVSPTQACGEGTVVSLSLTTKGSAPVPRPRAEGSTCATPPRASGPGLQIGGRQSARQGEPEAQDCRGPGLRFPWCGSRLRGPRQQECGGAEGGGISGQVGGRREEKNSQAGI